MKKQIKETIMYLIILSKFYFPFTFAQSQPTSQNLLKNSHFRHHKCLSDYCNIPSQSIPHYMHSWRSQKFLQLGQGHLYSDNIDPYKYIVRLKDNYCIKQTIVNAPQKQLRAEIHWAVKRQPVGNQSGLDLYFNGVRVERYVSKTFNLTNTTKIYIPDNGPQNCGTLEIKLCGHNVLVSEVSLYVNMITQIVIQYPSAPLTGFRNPNTVINFPTSQCVQKRYTFLPQNQGYYSLKLLHRAINILNLSLSSIQFYWNDQLSLNYHPNSQTQTPLTMQIYATADENILKICPTECFNENKVYHQVIINNQDQLQFHSCKKQQYVNLIKNGGFEESTCPNGVSQCEVKEGDQNAPLLIPSGTLATISQWHGNQIIIIQLGQVFQKQLPMSHIIDFDMQTYNQCIYQTLPTLKPDRYRLQFDYISQNSNFQSNAFRVGIQSLFQYSKTPTNTTFNHQIYDFSIAQAITNKKFYVCAEGALDYYSVLVDNFQLRFISACG